MVVTLIQKLFVLKKISEKVNLELKNASNGGKDTYANDLVAKVCRETNSGHDESCSLEVCELVAVYRDREKHGKHLANKTYQSRIQSPKLCDCNNNEDLKGSSLVRRVKSDEANRVCE